MGYVKWVFGLIMLGLVVAIPTFILYSYLATYARTLMHDMERGGIEIVNIIEDARNSSEILPFKDRGEGGKDSDKEEPSAGKNRRKTKGGDGSVT